MTDQSTAEDFLADYIEIKSVYRLNRVLSDLKGFLNRGLICQVGGNYQLSNFDFSQPITDDFVEMKFETIPGRTKYLLSCEIYRRYGGSFERVLQFELSPKTSREDMKEYYALKIKRQYAIGAELSEVLSQKLVEEIEVQGGNPYVEIETEQCIRTVVRNWLQWDDFIDGSWKLVKNKPSELTKKIYTRVAHCFNEGVSFVSRSTADKWIYPKTFDLLEAMEVLKELQANGIVDLKDDEIDFLKIKKLPGKKVGAEQLLKGYIWKFWDGASISINKKTAAGIFKTRMEAYDIESESVKAAFSKLAEAQVLQYIGGEADYLKILKSPSI